MLAATNSIHAEIVGDNTCSALGITARATAPVLALCRALIGAGYNSATPLQAYRGDILCLTVRSIGLGAALEVRPGRGTGTPVFVRTLRGSTRAAPPMRKTGEPGAEAAS